MRISIIGIPGAGKSTLASTLSTVYNCMYVPEQATTQDVYTAVGKSNAYILDGFPRTAENLAGIMRRLRLQAVVYLDTNPAESMLRLQARQRPGDKASDIHSRISSFYAEIDPILDYFEDKGILLNIGASGPPSEIVGKTILALDRMGHAETKYYVRYPFARAQREAAELNRKDKEQ